MKKLMTMICVLALVLSLAACGNGGGEETTVTGMVVSLDGSVMTLVETDGTMDFSQMQRPEGMGNFDPESFEGTMPEGFEGEMPEGFEGMMGGFPGGFNCQMPEDFDPESLPEGFEGQIPEGFDGFQGGFPGGFDGEMPEGETRPQRGDSQRPQGMEGFTFEGETKEIDLANAHISVEVEGGKEGSSLESLTPGSFVTITINTKGQATYVLVSQNSGFNFRGWSK